MKGGGSNFPFHTHFLLSFLFPVSKYSTEFNTKSNENDFDYIDVSCSKLPRNDFLGGLNLVKYGKVYE